jgi:lysophospholipase L1-like esterase
VRGALKTALFVVYNVAFVCAALALAEYTARRVAYGQVESPGRRTELILDRWAAFRNNPGYKANAALVNAEGFRRDQDVSFDKPTDTVRVFLLGGSVAYGGETLYPEIDPHWKFLENSQTIDHYLEARLRSAFPQKRWEVVNAAVKGYFVNQDLALFLSTLQRYKPDYLVLFDGVNDMFEVLRTPEQDGYSAAGLGEEFNGLTNPESMSLRLMSATWLFNHSALYRSIRESVALRRRIQARRERAKQSILDLHPNFSRLNSNEQRQYREAAGRLENYLRTVQQIDALAKLQGAKTLFVLQPQIAVSRKPLTEIEKQLFDYWSRLDGPLDVYGFQALYPQLSGRLTTNAANEGYHFLDLTGVFDHSDVQTFTDYCHLTAAGNQIVADAIFDSFTKTFRTVNTDELR